MKVDDSCVVDRCKQLAMGSGVTGHPQLQAPRREWPLLQVP